jgi:hypothetical protein
LVERLAPTAVALPGDIQYESGTLAEFRGSFDPSWGRFKSISYPAPGNHEWYDTPNGQGYFDYFDGSARDQVVRARAGAVITRSTSTAPGT